MRIRQLSLVTLLAFAAKLILTGCTTPAKPPAPNFTAYSGEPEFSTDAGEPVVTTFRWRSSAGVDPTKQQRRAPAQPKFRWCVAKERGARPSGSNRCYDFESVSCELVNPGALAAAWECTGTVPVPQEFAGNAGDWYVRAENPDDHKSYSNSNTRQFRWTLMLPDLDIADLSINRVPTNDGLAVAIAADILNHGDADARNVAVRFSVTLKDGNLTLNPAVPDQTIPRVRAKSGTYPSEELVGYNVLYEHLGLARPFDVEVLLIVDPDNAIAESNESNNTEPDSKAIP